MSSKLYLTSLKSVKSSKTLLETAEDDDNSECTRNWKAARPDSEKRMWEHYDETGIFIISCRHGNVLFVCDMIKSGELYDHPLPIPPLLIQFLVRSIRWQWFRQSSPCTAQMFSSLTTLAAPLGPPPGGVALVPCFSRKIYLLEHLLGMASHTIEYVNSNIILTSRLAWVWRMRRGANVYFPGPMVVHASHGTIQNSIENKYLI
jgi:hypothetical protein